MKQYTYPAVFYFDEEYSQYAVEFSDICIYAEGETIEEAYKNAQNYLIKYLECCDELGVEPNEPNTYNFVEESHPNGKTMLVTVDYEQKSQAEKQETYTNLNDDIVEDMDSDMLKGIESELSNDNPVMNELLRESVIKKSKAADDDGDDDFSLPEIE